MILLYHFYFSYAYDGAFWERIKGFNFWFMERGMVLDNDTFFASFEHVVNDS